MGWFRRASDAPAAVCEPPSPKHLGQYDVIAQAMDDLPTGPCTGRHRADHSDDKREAS